MFLNQQIIVHSTDAITEYTDAKSFVESLENYLKIQTQLPANLAMISVGQEAPDQQYQDVPWLQLDESNNPLALRYYNGIEWIETRPYKTIQAPYEGLYVQYGEVSYNHIQSATNLWIDSKNITQNDGSIGRFAFPEPFKAGTTVTVQLTPVIAAVQRDGGTEAEIDALDDFPGIETYLKDEMKGYEWALGNDVDYEGFHIWTKTQDVVALGLAVKFRWMAMGEKA